MKEREFEKHASSRMVVWAAFVVTAAFLLTGLWYMYVKPLLAG